MKKNILLLILSVFLTLAISEKGVRLLGYFPGYLGGPFHFHKVDSLFLYKGYAADLLSRPYIEDSTRILVNFITDSLFKCSSRGDIKGKYYELQDKYLTKTCDEFAEVPLSYSELWSNPEKHELGRIYQGILNKQKLNDYDSAIINYVRHPINSSGYKSIEFRAHSSKKRVMMLGDSFAWGWQAKCRVDCFSDLLLARGFEVYNTGMSATDAPQYMAIARKFVPLVKPDVLVANIYLGNDIMYFKQKLLPYQTHIYPTNAGYLPPCPRGVSLPSADSSYRFVLNAVSIPKNANWFNQICYHSSLATLIWRSLQNFLPETWTKDKGRVAFEEMAENKKMEYPYINDEMKELRMLCTENGTRLIICIIPNFYISANKKMETYYVNYYPRLFENEIYYEPHNILKEDYSHAGDGHFNDAGHKKYADFLEQLLVKI